MTIHQSRRAHAVLGLAVTALLAAGACDPHSTGSGGSGAGAGPTASGVEKTVPDLVGKGLQSAQDAAQAAGFRHLTSHDATGGLRHQILDRDWKVCFQTPAAGATASTGATVDLAAVKRSENCPATDRKPPAKVGATMPDFTGKGLLAARDSLPRGTKVTEKDASSRGRVVLLGSDWTVCSQSPAPGAAYHGQAVAFTAVKIGEHCP